MSSLLSGEAAFRLLSAIAVLILFSRLVSVGAGLGWAGVGYGVTKWKYIPTK
jgi:hypothetical protein